MATTGEQHQQLRQRRQQQQSLRVACGLLGKAVQAQVHAVQAQALHIESGICLSEADSEYEEMSAAERMTERLRSCGGHPECGGGSSSNSTQQQTEAELRLQRVLVLVELGQIEDAAFTERDETWGTMLVHDAANFGWDLGVVRCVTERTAAAEQVDVHEVLLRFRDNDGRLPIYHAAYNPCCNQAMFTYLASSAHSARETLATSRADGNTLLHRLVFLWLQPWPPLSPERREDCVRNMQRVVAFDPMMWVKTNSYGRSARAFLVAEPGAAAAALVQSLDDVADAIVRTKALTSGRVALRAATKAMESISRQLREADKLPANADSLWWPNEGKPALVQALADAPVETFALRDAFGRCVIHQAARAARDMDILRLVAERSCASTGLGSGLASDHAFAAVLRRRCRSGWPPLFWLTSNKHVTEDMFLFLSTGFSLEHELNTPSKDGWAFHQRASDALMTSNPTPPQQAALTAILLRVLRRDLSVLDAEDPWARTTRSMLIRKAKGRKILEELLGHPVEGVSDDQDDNDADGGGGGGGDGRDG